MAITICQDWEIKAQAILLYSAINTVYDFECMLTVATHLSCKYEYLNQLQQVSKHLPLAILLLS
jgi:hypothetical protein